MTVFDNNEQNKRLWQFITEGTVWPVDKTTKRSGRDSTVNLVKTHRFPAGCKLMKVGRGQW